MKTFIRLCKAYVDLVTTIVSLFTQKGLEAARWWTENVQRAIFKVAPPLLADLQPVAETVMRQFTQVWQTAGGSMLDIPRGALAEAARNEFAATESVLSSAGESTADNALDAAAKAIGEAFGFGIGSAAVTAAFESVFPERLNTLNGIGPMLSQMAGFEEVAKAVREPLYKTAFGQSLEYYYRAKFKPELPSERDAILWHSRELLTDVQLKKVFEASGLKTEYEAAFIQSAYRAVSPFILARAAETGAISDNDLRDVLTFGGYRKVDQERLIVAFREAALQPFRSQATSAFMSAAERGLYSGPDVDAELDALGVLEEARPFVKRTIAYRRLQELADLYRKSISDAYKYGQITDAQYVPLLENGGLNEADAAAHYDIDSIVLHGKEAAAAKKAEARLEAQRTRAALQALMVQFQKGIIDASALTLGLATSGIDPQVAASLVQLATARKAANQVFVFGLELDRDKAVLLREKVAAVEADVKAKQMTADAALMTLASFGIPQANAEALVANWAATAYKQVLTP